jgi:hypothetical protein
MGIITVKERSAMPSIPDTGFWKIYPKSDGLYMLDDAGNETLIALGSTGTWAGNSFSTYFDGLNDYGIVTHHSDFNFDKTSPFSISIWVDMHYVPGAAQMFFDKLDRAVSSFAGYNFFINSTGNINFQLVSDRATNDQIQMSTNTVVFNPGLNKKHIVAVYDGSNTPSGFKIYVDGVSYSLTQVSGGASISGSIQNTQNINLMSLVDISEFSAGRMDEVSFWDVALSLAEVTELYNSGNSFDYNTHSQANKQILWLRMGDGDSFPILTDRASASGYSQHDAILYNMNSYQIRYSPVA